MTQKRITDNLTVLLGVLPSEITSALEKIDRPDDLLEIILDLGRTPTARFTDCEVELSEREVTATEIDYVVSRIGDYDADNRAGIERTLHRISAIRNRHREIIGLTCRVAQLLVKRRCCAKQRVSLRRRSESSS